MANIGPTLSKYTGAAELSALLESDKYKIISVKSFGAVGDGVTDDTISIQTCLDYASINNCNVKIPSGNYKISSPINLPSDVSIYGDGMLYSVFLAQHSGNALQYLNGHIIDGSGNVTDFGSSNQSEYRDFGIVNQYPVTKDINNNYTSFNSGNGLHIEGLRYMGIVKRVRVVGGFTKGFYFFGAWGSSFEAIEVNGAKIGLHLDNNGNAAKIDRFYAKRTGFVTTVADGAGILVDTSLGCNIVSPIIESGVGSAAIKINTSYNVTIQNSYIERQTTNDRSIKISNSFATKIDNGNFQNTLGIEFDTVDGLEVTNCVFMGLSDPPTSNGWCIRSVTTSNSIDKNIAVRDCFRNIENGNGLPVTIALTDYKSIVWKQDDVYILTKDNFTQTRNFFPDPVFKNGTTGTLRTGVTATATNEYLTLAFNNANNTVWSDFSNLYTEYNSTSSSIYLIAKIRTKGDATKRIEIRPSSGTVETLNLPADNKFPQYYIIRKVTSNTFSYSLRFARNDGETMAIANEMDIYEVYFGFAGLKYLLEPSRIIQYTSSIPTTGVYLSGDLVINTDVTESGSIGSKYNIIGWKRITNGSNHVLNTDWFELRALTGN